MRSYCYILSGMGLSDQMRTVLYKHACHMFRARIQKKKFQTASGEGEIKTDFSYGSMGSVYGTIFTAELENQDQGRNTVKYIVQDWDVPVSIDEAFADDALHWVDVEPLPQNHPASKAAYN